MLTRCFCLLAGAAAFALFIETHGAQAADVAPEPVNEFQRAFYDDATFTFHLRSYLLDRYDTNGSDPAAWAVGGWLGYQTGWIGDVLQFGAVGYASLPLWAPEDRGGNLLLIDQEGFAVLGQAYAALKFEDNVATFYRQLVNQPEVNPQDNRMVPNTFEGATLGGDVGPVTYYGGVLTAMKKRDATEFVNIAGAAGVAQNEVMYLGGLAYAPNDDFVARTSGYVVPNLLASSYSDAAWSVVPTEDTKLKLSGQFMIQGGIGDELLTGPGFEAWIGGIKGDFTYGPLTLTAGYTFNGEDNDWRAPYGSWPGYTSMIVKDFNRAEEQAVLVGGTFDFTKVGIQGLVFTALAAFDTDVAPGLPMWNEYDFTADYRLSALEDGTWSWLSPLWIRARYALVDSDYEDGTSGQLDDFRVILNYDLQFTGKDL